MSASPEPPPGPAKTALLPDLVFLLLGAVTTVASLQLPIGSFRTPGSGLFPLLLGLLLIGLTAGHALQILRTRGPVAGSEAGRPGNYLRVGLFTGAVAAATALLPHLGFTPVAFLLLMAMMETLGVRPRAMSLSIALLTAGGSYFLFVRWLQIPLPQGWLGF